MKLSQTTGQDFFQSLQQGWKREKGKIVVEQVPCPAEFIMHKIQSFSSLMLFYSFIDTTDSNHSKYM